jgi:hypothetical protein
VRRVLALVIIAVLVGCGRPNGTQQAASGPATSSKGPTVFVKYDGPERLTRRYSRFFAIAAEDHGVRITETAREADSQMEVSITEEEIQDHINARVFRAGFVLPDGKSATVENCVGTSNGKPSRSPIPYTGVADELEKNYSSIKKIFLDPIKNDLEPQVVEVIKKELVDKHYILVATPAEADAVLRTMAATQEEVPMKATRYHVSYSISGAVSTKWSSSDVIYKEIQVPVPERAKVCVSSLQTWVYPNSVNQSGDFWSSAASAARELAKSQKDHSIKD